MRLCEGFFKVRCNWMWDEDGKYGVGVVSDLLDEITILFKSLLHENWSAIDQWPQQA